ncbi:MAG TPA: LysE family translocator [Burkholderiales bacterium]|nr:LysE family translocator [Burkholderiales bacterium]
MPSVEMVLVFMAAALALNLTPGPDILYVTARIAGAIYLVVIGIQLIVRPRTASQVAALPRSRLRVIFMQAVITNVLNPKVALFFLAFLPQFVDALAGPSVPQILLLGLLFNVQGTLVNVAVALLASRGTNWLRASERRVAALQRMTGALFVALGARLAVASNR